MKKIILGVLGVLFAVGCQQMTTPPAPTQVMGLLEVKFKSYRGQLSSSSKYIPMSAKLGSAASMVASNLPTVTANGVATSQDSNGRRYITATYNIANPAGGTTFTNLSFNAVKINSASLGALSVGNSALRNVKDMDGNALSTASIVESVVPGHKVNVGVGGAVTVPADGADFNYVPSSDVSTLQAAADASALGTGAVTVQNYAFTARTSGTNAARGIAAGGSGIVTLGYSYKIDTNTTTPNEFSVTYIVVNDPTTRVTRSLEESSRSVADVCTRAGSPVNATQIFILGAPLAAQACAGATLQNITSSDFFKTAVDFSNTSAPDSLVNGFIGGGYSYGGGTINLSNTRTSDSFNVAYTASGTLQDYVTAAAQYFPNGSNTGCGASNPTAFVPIGVDATMYKRVRISLASNHVPGAGNSNGTVGSLKVLMVRQFCNPTTGSNTQVKVQAVVNVTSTLTDYIINLDTATFLSNPDFDNSTATLNDILPALSEIQVRVSNTSGNNPTTFNGNATIGHIDFLK